MRLVAVLLTLVASSALAQEAPPAQAKAPEAKSEESSILTVRCMEDCNVRVDGKTGLRRDPRTWEFKDVAPGQRRVEVTGGLFPRPLFNGYADVPGGMRVVAQIGSNKRLTLIERTPLAQETAPKAAGTEPSVLNVRCPKACTVSVDGARKGAGQSKLVLVQDVTPGERNLEVKFILGKTVRTSLNIPAGSEVFVTATESGIQITNSKPLGK